MTSRQFSSSSNRNNPNNPNRGGHSAPSRNTTGSSLASASAPAAPAAGGHAGTATVASSNQAGRGFTGPNPFVNVAAAPDDAMDTSEDAGPPPPPPHHPAAHAPGPAPAASASAAPAPPVATDPNFSFVTPPSPYTMVQPRGLPRGTVYVPIALGLGVGIATSAAMFDRAFAGNHTTFFSVFPRFWQAQAWYQAQFEAERVHIVQQPAGSPGNPIVVNSAAPTPARPSHGTRTSGNAPNLAPGPSSAGGFLPGPSSHPSFGSSGIGSSLFSAPAGSSGAASATPSLGTSTLSAPSAVPAFPSALQANPPRDRTHAPAASSTAPTMAFNQTAANGPAAQALENLSTPTPRRVVIVRDSDDSDDEAVSRPSNAPQRAVHPSLIDPFLLEGPPPPYQAVATTIFGRDAANTHPASSNSVAAPTAAPTSGSAAPFNGVSTYNNPGNSSIINALDSALDSGANVLGSANSSSSQRTRSAGPGSSSAPAQSDNLNTNTGGIHSASQPFPAPSPLSTPNAFTSRTGTPRTPMTPEQRVNLRYVIEAALRNHDNTSTPRFSTAFNTPSSASSTRAVAGSSVAGRSSPAGSEYDVSDFEDDEMEAVAYLCDTAQAEQQDPKDKGKGRAP